MFCFFSQRCALLRLPRCQTLFIPLMPPPSRSKMPEKTDEERERMAKKLAEQRAKMEGMPTTAKVDSTLPASYRKLTGSKTGYITSIYWSFCLFVFFCLFIQLKIDEFESNVNEVKDPFPPDDFPGAGKYVYVSISNINRVAFLLLIVSLYECCCHGCVTAACKDSNVWLLIDLTWTMSQVFQLSVILSGYDTTLVSTI